MGRFVHFVHFVALIALIALVVVMIESAQASDETAFKEESHQQLFHSNKVRIAIVGAGIGGSSAAYFINKDFGSGFEEESQSVEITVLEREEKSCGRINDIVVTDDNKSYRMEIGASVYHKSNRYISDAVSEFGLKTKNQYKKEIESKLSLTERLQQSIDNLIFKDSMPFGIWNGSSFTFVSHPRWEWWTHAKLVAAYGLAPLAVQSTAIKLLDNFVRIYELQGTHKSYEKVTSLIKDIGLYYLTRDSLKDNLLKSGVAPNYIDDMVTGIMRVNYGQDTTVNALVGFISLIGGEEDDLESVYGGNRQLCDNFLQRSGARVVYNANVKTISHQEPSPDESSNLHPHRRYKVTYEHQQNSLTEEEFDAVIIASPIKLGNIQIDGIPSLHPLPSPIEDTNFQVTHVTLLKGKLRPDYFSQEHLSVLPQRILTTESNNIPFNSLFAWEALSNGRYLYKLFSRQQIEDSLLYQLFDFSSEKGKPFIYRTKWHAYPILPPNITYPPFLLHDDLYYVNALESAFSTMETEVIAAKNVANLLFNRLRTNHQTPEE